MLTIVGVLGPHRSWHASCISTNYTTLPGMEIALCNFHTTVMVRCLQGRRTGHLTMVELTLGIKPYGERKVFRMTENSTIRAITELRSRAAKYSKPVLHSYRNTKVSGTIHYCSCYDTLTIKLAKEES